MKILSGSPGQGLRRDPRGRAGRWRSRARATRSSSGIRTIYQELNLVPSLSAAANIFLGAEPGRFGVLDRRAAEKEAARLLAELGVSVDPSRPVRELGIAHQQMVEVAKALSEEGRILVMDEPTSALTAAEIDAALRHHRAAAGAGARPSSTSRTAWRRSRASATASP